MARRQVNSTQEALRSTGPGGAPDDGAEVLKKGERVEHYAIMRLLTRGGMGEVYVARDMKLGRKVALKLIHPKYLGSASAVERFLDEAKTTARFNHPHIVTIHGVGEHEGRPYVALEYLEGQNLRERMLERRPSLQATLRIALAVAEALTEAHEAGVLHLDLKPENVVIPRDGRVRVVDFGLARPVRVETTSDTAEPRADGETEPPLPLEDAGAKAGGVWGTPAYMAPEQWKKRTCTGATDVWALGMMLYELCSDWLPYDLEGSKSKLMEAVCAPDAVPKVDRYADVPPELSELLAHCLDKDPKRRPPAAEVAEALRELLFGEATRPADEEGPFRGLLPFTERHVDLFFGREAEVAAFVERARAQSVLPVVGPSGAGKSSFVQAGVMPRMREQEAWSFVKMRPGTRPFDTLASRLLRIEHATVTIPNAAYTGQTSVAPGLLGSGYPSSGHPSSGHPSNGHPSSGQPDDVAPLVGFATGSIPPTIPPAPRAPRIHTSGAVSGPQTVPPLSDAPIGMERADALRLADQLKEEPRKLALALRRLAAAQGSKVMLFIDQLEELFTLVDDEAERNAFMEAICTAADDPQDPVRIVFTVRDDFLGRLATSPEVTQALAHVTVIQNLDASALEDVLVKPVRAVGYRFQDDDMPREMIASVADAIGSLPLLQFAARLLWERRDKVRRLLLRSAYQDMGGVEGALAQHADGVLDALGPEELAIARELVLRMVTPERTRRRIPKEEALDGLGDDGGRVLGRLTNARLVAASRRGRASGGGTMLELAHESLIRTWGTLARWLDDSRDELSFLEEAGQAAELWDRRGRPQQEVWQGEALAEALRKLARCTTDVAPKVRAFLDAGRSREQRRVRRKRALLALAVGTSAMVAAIAMVVAWFVAQKEREAQLQRAATLRESARSALGQGSTLEARAKLRMSLEVEDDPAARALWWQLSSNPLAWQKELGERMYSVEFSPDGRTLAAGGHDEAIYLFDVITRETRVLHGNADQVFSISFSPDGRRMATASFGGSVKLWDVSLETPIRVINDDASRSSDVSFSPDGERLASGGPSGDVYLWDARTGEAAAVLSGHKDQIYDVAFSRDGSRLASAGNDGTVRIWSVAHKTVERVLETPGGALYAVDFDGTGLIAAGGADKTVRVWSVDDGKLKSRLVGHKEAVRTLAFEANGTRLASGSDDGTARLWDGGTGESITTWDGHDDAVSDVDVSSDGRWVASASRDHSVRLWDTRAVAGLEMGHGDMPGAQSVAFSPDGALLATAHYDGRVRLWDAASGDLKRTLSGHTASLYDVVFSPDGAILASGGNDWSVRLWDVVSESARTVLAGHRDGVMALAFSPDRKRLVSTSRDRTVRIWDLESQTAVAVIEGVHEKSVMDVAYAPDGTWFATGSSEGIVRVFDAETFELRYSFGDRSTPVGGIAISADSSSIVSGHNDGTVWLWDRKRDERQLVGRHPERVYWLSFHPGGQRVGAPGSDGTARIWSLDSKKHVELSGHLDEVNNIQFSPDGKRAATVADDGTLRTWDAETGRPFWHAPALLPAPPRLLSHQGWQRLDGGEPDSSEPRWAEAVRERARWATYEPRGSMLCIHTFEDVLELWDTSKDERLLREHLPGLEEAIALADGYLARASSGAWLYRHSSDSKQRLLDARVSAMAAGERGLVLASGNELHTFGLGGERLGRFATGSGITAVAQVGDDVAVGYRDGNLELVATRPDDERPKVIFQGVPSAAPRHILAGPMDTLVVGYENGFVGMWNRRDGTPLVGSRLHGRLSHLMLDGRKLHAATDLGRHLSWDLEAFHVDYCTLLREVWSQVPVTWELGRPVSTERPRDHHCR